VSHSVRNIDGHNGVFLQCQGLMKNNKFTNHVNVAGFDLPSTTGFTW
jgi:hypothetical protein